MRVYMYTVQLPSDQNEERIIKSVVEKGDDIVRWKTKELDKYYSGEFGWKKLPEICGVIAIQYINLNTVRLLVRVPMQEMANSVAIKFSKYINPKKEHKKPYARRASNTNTISTTNQIAVNKALSEIKVS